MAKYTMDLPEPINQQFTQVSAEDDITKAEILRKALNLFFAVRQARQRGDTVGIVAANNRDALKTEFIGL